MQAHLHEHLHACKLNLHLHPVTGRLLYVHATAMIALIRPSGPWSATRAAHGSGWPARFGAGLRRLFRRGHHRVGNHPQRQWTMTLAPALRSARLRGRVGRQVR